LKEKQTMKDIVEKIEELRRLLYSKIDEGKEMNEEEISTISQILDKLINEFYKLKNKN
jgi:hypothetical protein